MRDIEKKERYKKYLHLKLKLIEYKPGRLYKSLEDREKTVKEFLMLEEEERNN